MKIKNVFLISLLFILMSMVALPGFVMAALPPIELGTTTTFALLAGTRITNTGNTVINGSVGGNVGLFPGTEFTGQSTAKVSGTVHLANSITIAAKDDLEMAYNSADGRKSVTRIPSELGDTKLKSGVYESPNGKFNINGTLILDADGDSNAVFIFKTDSTLNTAPKSNIILLNGARFCRVFWKVGSSVTLGKNSHFVGHIFAFSSITAEEGATVQGQLMVRNGEITLNSNIISNGNFDYVPPTIKPTIKPIISRNNSRGTGTTKGGKLPKTASYFFEFIFIGAVLIIIGAAGIWSSKRSYE